MSEAEDVAVRIMADCSRFVRALAQLGGVIEMAVNAVARFYDRVVPRHVRKRYTEPTPWHMKRARVALRRRGEPVMGAAALAKAWRRDGHTP